MKLKEKLPILIYDEECPLCVRFSQGVKIVDKNKLITHISLHTPELYKEFKQLNLEECHKAVHFIDPNEKIYVGTDAIKKMIELIPQTQKFSWLVEKGMGEKVLTKFHRAAEKARDVYLKHCSNCQR